MLLTEYFEQIDPDEKKSYAFDFSDYLDSGDTISSQSWTATVKSGTDASASSRLSGSPSITGGTICAQFIDNAVSGVTYYLTCQVVTANGSNLELSAVLPCI